MKELIEHNKRGVILKAAAKFVLAHNPEARAIKGSMIQFNGGKCQVRFLNNTGGLTVGDVRFGLVYRVQVVRPLAERVQEITVRREYLKQDVLAAAYYLQVNGFGKLVGRVKGVTDEAILSGLFAFVGVKVNFT